MPDEHIKIRVDDADRQRQIVKLPPEPQAAPAQEQTYEQKPQPAAAPAAPEPSAQTCPKCGKVGVLVIVKLPDLQSEDPNSYRQDLRCEHCFRDAREGKILEIIKWGVDKVPGQ